MNVKLSTKEKFVVLEILEADLPANMSAELSKMLTNIQESELPFLVLDLSSVNHMEEDVAREIAAKQAIFYEKGYSFVICSMKEEVAAVFSTLGLQQQMNITPTQSEAWDIIQMEEIERELLKDFED